MPQRRAGAGCDPSLSSQTAAGTRSGLRGCSSTFPWFTEALRGFSCKACCGPVGLEPGVPVVPEGHFCCWHPIALLKGRAGSGEPCVAGMGSLRLNFWTPYSTKPEITPQPARRDVCERCSQKCSSSPTGETSCDVKLTALSPYLRGS